MNETIAVIIEVGVGLVTVPFIAWVVSSIFELKTQTSLIGKELELLRKVCEKLLG